MDKKVMPSSFKRHFRIPDNYFEDLEARMTEKMKASASYNRFSRGYKIIAALFLLVILMTPFIKKTVRNDSRVFTDLDKVPVEIMDDYLLMNYENDMDLITP